MKNLKNDGHCLVITTQSDKVTIDPAIPMVHKPRNFVVDLDEAPEVLSKNLLTNVKSSLKSTSVNKGLGNVDDPVVKIIPRPTPPFPYRLKKKNNEGIYKNSIVILKELRLNIPIFEDPNQVLRYIKFRKY